MTRESELKCLEEQRKELIQELKAIYRKRFDSLKHLDVKERTLSKLIQAMLQSQEGALIPLEQELEKQLITKAPK